MNTILNLTLFLSVFIPVFLLGVLVIILRHEKAYREHINSALKEQEDYYETLAERVQRNKKAHRQGRIK